MVESQSEPGPPDSTLNSALILGLHCEVVDMDKIMDSE